MCVRNLSKKNLNLSFLSVDRDLNKPIESAKPTSFVDSIIPITTKEAVTNQRPPITEKVHATLSLITFFTDSEVSFLVPRLRQSKNLSPKGEKKTKIKTRLPNKTFETCQNLIKRFFYCVRF